MKYKKLSEVEMPKIAIGTWAWGSGVNGGKMIFGNSVNQVQLQEAFELALKHSLYLWDTAPVYGNGSSERLLGEYFKNHQEKMISTKFMPYPFCPKSVFHNSIKKSLERLQIKSIDIFWIHTAFNSKKWLLELIPYIKQNKVKYVGVSNHNLEQLKQVKLLLDSEGIPLSAVQNHFSLLCRDDLDNGLLHWCNQFGIKYFGYMLLEQGALTGVYNENNPFKRLSMRGLNFPIRKLRTLAPLLDKLNELALKYDTSITGINIAWALSRNVVPLVGVTKKSHIQALVEARNIELLPDESHALENCAKQLKINTRGVWE